MDDEEGGNRPPAYDRAPSNLSVPKRDPESQDRSKSPLPAPTPQRPGRGPRESLDGETIFAVGEEDGDRYSESDDERKGFAGR